MVNYVLDTTTTEILDTMVDSSGTGIAAVPWNQYEQKWANITTLTPTITRDTMFQGRNTNPAYFNGEQTFIDLIHNEAGWTNILYVKPFTIPSNEHLKALQACLMPGDTIQIKIELKNNNSGKTPIGVSLLYTHTASSPYPGITSSSTASILPGSDVIGTI
jgi:hypothetical protein